MKKTAVLFILLAFTVWVGCDTASAASAAVIAIEDSVAGMSALSAEKVRQGIIEAGTKRGWQMRDVSKTELEGTLHNRGHMVKVRIPYTSKKYSILYKDSENMKYDAAKNTIHSSYTRWVRNLDKDITLKLQSMQ